MPVTPTVHGIVWALLGSQVGFFTAELALAAKFGSLEWSRGTR